MEWFQKKWYEKGFKGSFGGISWITLWKQHFENLLGNPPKITHEPITRIISKQLDIKLEPFTQEELDSVLRKI